MTQKKPSHAEPKRDDAIRDSFPASDPPANPASKGARAVPVEDMKPGPAPEPDGAATLSAPFASAEAAKLALEALAREGPLPREHMTIEAAPAGVVLKLRVQSGDRSRIRTMLEREAARA
ncbi:hypothetical protein GXW71_09040 [Roseomonas hellenica]|uniref:Flagellar hook-length control protein FliK n=1 Tax=Plastoroseomonas hellenica TaxID=2687306 RepID=A0ABS5EW19_9PROT|nr:hypothetical protein [Plastoroseomonas hellenica]MBR0664495.1 hypothetical protein [Plastoroseomonas hellenica]